MMGLLKSKTYIMKVFIIPEKTNAKQNKKRQKNNQKWLKLHGELILIEEVLIF